MLAPEDAGRHVSESRFRRLSGHRQGPQLQAWAGSYCIHDEARHSSSSSAVQRGLGFGRIIGFYWTRPLPICS